MPDVSFERLATPRLILRRFRPEDLESFVAYRADPDVARYQSWENFTRADGVQFIDEMATLHPDTPGQWFQIAIELQMTGRMIGDCALHPIADAPNEVEIGFTVAPAFQGRGHATEAVTCLLHYLFQSRRKDRVLALTDARNAQSISVLQRLGFSRDMAPRPPVTFKGERCEEHLYRLVRNEWRMPS